MNKDTFNAQNEKRILYDVDYIKKYDWLFGNVHYIGDEIFGEEFHDGKLCSYYIRIEGQMLNGNLYKMDDTDVKNICDFYKTSLKQNYTFAEFPKLWWGSKVYVFTKNNMVITLRYEYRELLIKCENRPVSAPIEIEKYKKREEEGKNKYRPRFQSQYPYSRS